MKKEIKLFDKQSVKLEINEEDDSVWLTLDDIAKLYERDKKTVALHIKNILIEEAFLTNVTKYVKDGSKREVCYYNIDVIISVGYRVKSEKGVLFRKLANQIIKKKLLNDSD